MINFNPANVNDEIILSEIISKKREPQKLLLQAISPYIISRYQVFIDNTNDIDNILVEDKIGENEQHLLEESYKSAVDIKNLKVQIKNQLPDAIKAKCPYCMISAYNTLDHYFDKKTYPEYSLFSKNLVPCCFECNSYKGVKFRDLNGVRKTINFYYDKLPDRQFIFFDMYVDFELPDPIPTFEVRLELDASSKIDCIIRNHFDTLKLIRRYKDQIPDKFSTIIDEAERHYIQKHDIYDVVTALKIRIAVLREMNGVNYWEACLYEAIIREQDVLEKILQLYVCN